MVFGLNILHLWNMWVSNIFEHKGKWWYQTESEACGAYEEPIGELPIRNTVSHQNAFPVFSLNFGVTCRETFDTFE